VTLCLASIGDADNGFEKKRVKGVCYVKLV